MLVVRLLYSGPNDHVFVNFADHGAPGLIAFPVGVVSIVVYRYYLIG